MFGLLEHLCPRLGRAGLDVLYGHLRGLPPQYEKMHVQLIQRFAEAASGWGAQGGSAQKAKVSDGEIDHRMVLMNDSYMRLIEEAEEAGEAQSNPILFRTQRARC